MSMEAHGSAGAEFLLIQPVDTHDLAEMETEVSAIRARVKEPFLLVPVPVASWNGEYSLPRDAKLILGGYSLAGLFALWCGHETDLFDGIAAASPSVWFPGFLNYAAQRPFWAKAVYLSLGDKEERTRNPVMRQVGDSIRALHVQYQKAPDTAVTLEWNEGNHFRDPGLRTAKAFAWTIGKLER